MINSLFGSALVWYSKFSCAQCRTGTQPAASPWYDTLRTIIYRIIPPLHLITNNAGPWKIFQYLGNGILHLKSIHPLWKIVEIHTPPAEDFGNPYTPCGRLWKSIHPLWKIVEIHTPPVQDCGNPYTPCARLWKSLPHGECEYSNAPDFCVIFSSGLSQREYISI